MLVALIAAYRTWRASAAFDWRCFCNGDETESIVAVKGNVHEESCLSYSSSLAATAVLVVAQGTSVMPHQNPVANWASECGRCSRSTADADGGAAATATRASIALAHACGCDRRGAQSDTNATGTGLKLDLGAMVARAKSGAKYVPLLMYVDRPSTTNALRRLGPRFRVASRDATVVFQRDARALYRSATHKA
jgi:hypothetical protein